VISAFFKTHSTSIRSTTTIPLISRLRLHRTMPIASPAQWISFNHRYPSTVLHHRLHSPSPHLIVDAGPAHATYTVPMSAPREPVISAPKEPAMSAPGEPPPREPRQSSKGDSSNPVPTPPPKRKSTPNKAPPPSQYRRFSRTFGASYLIDSGTSVSHSYDTSDIANLVADPTFASVFILNGIDSPLSFL
jgi:hypothetical protein